MLKIIQPVKLASLAKGMDYIREYRNFINNYYLAGAVRICFGALVPAIVMSYFGSLSAGIMAALGSIMVSPADGPGPIHHRRNAMLACIGVIFLMALATGYIANNEVLLGIWIAFACFGASMIAVYGERVNGIGLSALIVMAIVIGRIGGTHGIITNSLIMAAGAAWYTLLSLILHSVRPYRLPQQALGDCIIATAEYLRIRSSFYQIGVEFDKVYSRLMEAQVDVHRKQNLVRELIFKSRHITRESTTTSRTLVMIFIEIVDLFEKSTTSFYDYNSLKRNFGESGILGKFSNMISSMATELDVIGLAVMSGRASREPVQMQEQLRELQASFDEFRNKYRKPETLEALIMARKVLQAIEDMAARINNLHHHSKYDKEKAESAEAPTDYKQFLTPQVYSWKLLRDNLTIESNIFRHALRVSIATTAGYLLAKALTIGHSYWILLTIIVILKPTFSLTRKRNFQRLIGTIAGALFGVLILFLFKDRTMLFVWMLVLMVGSYSFMRTNYLVGVIFMTPYILIMFSLLNQGDYKMILQDRIVDTAIASAIAFLASLLLVPTWEQDQMQKHLSSALESSREYFKQTSAAFTGNAYSDLDFRLSRKAAYVALANFSEAFTRMLDEPRIKQRNSKEYHQLVVLNHVLNSHIAALAHYLPFAEKYNSSDFRLICREINNNLGESIKISKGEQVSTPPKEVSRLLDEKMNELVDTRKKELEQGYTQTETRLKLMELKPIVDQFNFIASVAREIRQRVGTVANQVS